MNDDPKLMRNLSEKFTEVVAEHIHFFERQDEIDLAKCRASEIEEMTNGAIDRYKNDAIFNARVASMVIHLMHALDDTPLNEKNVSKVAELNKWNEHNKKVIRGYQEHISKLQRQLSSTS